MKHFIAPALILALSVFAGAPQAQTNWQRQQQEQQRQQQMQQEQQRRMQEEQRRQAQEQQRRQMQEDQRRRMQEEQRQRMQAEQRQRMQEQQRQQMQDQQRQQMQAQQRQQITDQQRRQAQDQQRQNAQRQGTLNRDGKQTGVVMSGGMPKMARPLTPGEIQRGFTGRTTADGRALIKYQGRVFTVPASRVAGLSARLAKQRADRQAAAGGSGGKEPSELPGNLSGNTREQLLATTSPPAVAARLQAAQLARLQGQGFRDDSVGAMRNPSPQESGATQHGLMKDVRRGDSIAVNQTYVSERALAEGWKPPHSEGSALRTFVTADTVKFVRVHGDRNKPQGGFLVRAKEIEHLNGDPEKIRQYLGLKEVPRFISDVDVPPNTRMEVSVIGAQPNFGLDRSSGFQYVLKEEIPDDSFKNTRPLR